MAKLAIRIWWNFQKVLQNCWSCCCKNLNILGLLVWEILAPNEQKPWLNETYSEKYVEIHRQHSFHPFCTILKRFVRFLLPYKKFCCLEIKYIWAHVCLDYKMYFSLGYEIPLQIIVCRRTELKSCYLFPDLKYCMETSEIETMLFVSRPKILYGNKKNWNRVICFQTKNIVWERA